MVVLNTERIRSHLSRGGSESRTFFVKSHLGIAPSPSLTNTKHGGDSICEERLSVGGLARALDVACDRV